jgi:hypothetical protein
VRKGGATSLAYVIITCNDVTRACSGEIGQKLLTRHFLASLYAYDTIERLRLACYDLRTFIQASCNKHISTSVMACLHGNAASYNLLEVERLCVEFCNGCQAGHPSQRQHDCFMMNENKRWQMYGLQAIERVNGKRMVWNEFAEAMRVQKLAVDRDVLEHLRKCRRSASI